MAAMVKHNCRGLSAKEAAVQDEGDMLFPVLPLPGKRERVLTYLRAICVGSAFLGAWQSSLPSHNTMYAQAKYEGTAQRVVL